MKRQSIILIFALLMWPAENVLGGTVDTLELREGVSEDHTLLSPALDGEHVGALRFGEPKPASKVRPAPRSQPGMAPCGDLRQERAQRVFTAVLQPRHHFDRCTQ
jgi:hypothetical protein